jgi:hypothetical protein
MSRRGPSDVRTVSIQHASTATSTKDAVGFPTDTNPYTWEQRSDQAR